MSQSDGGVLWPFALLALACAVLGSTALLVVMFAWGVDLLVINGSARDLAQAFGLFVGAAFLQGVSWSAFRAMSGA